MRQKIGSWVFYIVIALLSQPCFASSLFTLSVTKTDETCPGNGTLTFTASSTTPGSTITYSIFLLPNVTNAISVQSTNTLTGLSSGTYRVVASETSGSTTTSQQQDVTILSSVTAVSFQLVTSKEICGNDGSVAVTVNTGNAVAYEIFSGPILFPPQAGSTFTTLIAGNYQIRVFDSCGQGIVQSFTIQAAAPGINIGSVSITGGELDACDIIKANNNISAPANMAVAYPLAIQYTVYPPVGTPIVINTIAAGSENGVMLAELLPFYHDQQYTYDVQVTDACGNIYSSNGNVINQHLSVTVATPPRECSKALTVSASIFVAPFTVQFLSAPAGFDPSLYNTMHPGPFTEAVEYYNPALPLPQGTYIVQVTDACGRTATSQATMDLNNTVNPITVVRFLGCQTGFGSLSLSSTKGPLQSVTIMSAPAGFPATMPFDVNFNIAANGSFYMNNLPGGAYVFKTLDPCGNEQLTTVTMPGYLVSSSEIMVTENCGSFDLLLEHASNLTHSHQFWLQKFNTASGLWGHPLTGSSAGVGLSNNNAIMLINYNTIFGIATSGSFRIMKSFSTFGNGTNQLQSCNTEIHNFEFTGMPGIDDIFTFSCSPTTSDVVVTAHGAAPMIYRIVSQNGQPVDIQNGNSNIFLGLQPAVYTFQIEDGCGNILNQVVDITEPVAVTITATNFCDGQPASLSVPNLGFLTFEWTKGNDPTVIGTTHELQFASFDAATDNGMYNLHVSFPNPNSCIDLVVNYNVTAEIQPQAGHGLATSFCERPGSIDLFTLLDGNYDLGGQWTENVPSGGLQDNIFSPALLPVGNYQFIYTVTGSCSTASTMVSITLNQVPQLPVVSADNVVCSGGDIQLSAAGDAIAIYQWTGPNGFSSSLQNPLISDATTLNTGIYTVTATIGNCVSQPVHIKVNVAEEPQFTITQGCIGQSYIAAVSSSGLPFEDSVMISWSGPRNFSGTGNNVPLRGGAGAYEVTVDVDGCTATLPFEVAGTACSIPLGISPNGDGDNEMLDLSGMDVQEIKIFSRYGNVVYEQHNYTDQWHGQDYNGRQLPPATYYYYARFGSGLEKTGWIYLATEN